MLIDAVAAGDGAFSTWIILGASMIRKSSTSEPSGSTARARISAPPRPQIFSPQFRH